MLMRSPHILAMLSGAVITPTDLRGVQVLTVSAAHQYASACAS